MSTKRKIVNSTQRQAISLEKKIEILDRLKSGQGSTCIAKHYGMNESTIRTIKRSEESIRKSVASGTAVSAKFSTYKRDHLIEVVEKALIIWIDDNGKKRIPIDTNAIKYKALHIFNHLKEKEPTTPTTEFSASKGWFENFKKRHNLHNLQLKGEIASGDEKSAKEYPQKLDKIIKDNDYLPDQVFNADETGLFWKRMPKRTYLSKSEKSASGFKAAKDRVTLLFCSNSSGDFMLKPLFINRAQRPRAMKGINISDLPVHWRANNKAWMTCALFEDWFHNCFVPEVKTYLAKKNLEFKVLLLLDNSPSHPVNLQNPNVHIEFLPPNTTSMIQPQDQGIISTFKAYYIRRSFADVLNQLDENSQLTLPEVWKKFTILKCVKHVVAAVAEIKKSTLNGCWKIIWPEVVSENNVVPATENVFENIIDLAHSIGGEGFDDLNIDDIDELFEDNEITNADLLDMVNRAPDVISEISSDSDNAPEPFTANIVGEGLRLGRQLQTYFLNRDPVNERATKFQRSVKAALCQYEEVFKDLSQGKQMLMTDFIKSTKKTLLSLLKSKMDPAHQIVNW